MRRWLIIAAGILALGALSAGAAYERAGVGDDANAPWREIAWPFPRDGWPAGKAFRRGDVEVYVRPKIGFCNCDTGVADDDEVDRVADLDLISEHFAPLEPGRAVRIADMAGRIRPYELSMPDGRGTAPSASRCRTVAICWWRPPRAAAVPSRLSAWRWSSWSQRRCRTGCWLRWKGVRRGTAVHLSAARAVRHDEAHQFAHVELQIPDDVLDDVSDRDHAHDLAGV